MVQVAVGQLEGAEPLAPALAQVRGNVQVRDALLRGDALARNPPDLNRQAVLHQMVVACCWKEELVDLQTAGRLVVRQSVG